MPLREGGRILPEAHGQPLKHVFKYYSNLAFSPAMEPKGLGFMQIPRLMILVF